MESTPASLLCRLRQTSAQEDWDRFVKLYKPLLSLWAGRLGLRGVDVPDVVQDVLAQVYRKLPHFSVDPGRTFRGWLQTVLINRLKDIRRRKVAHGMRTEDFPLDDFRANDEHAAEKLDYQRYLVTRTAAFLRDEFPPASWRAFWLSAVEGKSAAETGAELNMTAGAVRAAKFLILCRLRRELRGLLD
jgi:RNA polymerase sigma-70 factor (ECF subfamily)